MGNTRAICPAYKNHPYGKRFCHLLTSVPEKDMDMKTIYSIRIALLAALWCFGQEKPPREVRINGEGVWIGISRDPATGDYTAASHPGSNSASFGF